MRMIYWSFMYISFIAINLEKQEVEKIQEIEGFKKDSLKHTEPTVKNVLPDQDSKIHYYQN